MQDDPMLLIVVFTTMALYLLSIAGRTFVLEQSTSNRLRILQFIIVAILLSLWSLSKFDIYLRGYWMPKIIICISVIIGMILASFADKSKLLVAERIFYRAIYLFPIALISLIVIPVVGGAIIMRVYETAIGSNSFMIYSDATYRLEKNGFTLMGPEPNILVFKKDGIFSHKVADLPSLSEMQADRIEVNESRHDSLQICYLGQDGLNRDSIIASYSFPK